MEGARLREQAPGWCLFPVYWFPGGEGAPLRSCREQGGGRPKALAASQPHSLVSGDCWTPPSEPPWTNIQSFPRTRPCRSRSRCGREGAEGWEETLPPQKYH